MAATAVHDGLETARMALIAAPAHYIDYVRQFAQQVALDPSRLPALVTALQAFGVDVESISLPRMAARMRAPALFVHSEDDQVVPISDAEQTVAGWPASSLLRVAGLGHKRILHDTSVLKAVIDFVAAYPE